MGALKDPHSLTEDLERLRAVRAEFNPFFVLQSGLRERTHEAMLAWLLRPSENHGLGVEFLQAILRKARVNDAAMFDAETVVQCQHWSEGSRVDILITNESNRGAVVVELKTMAGARYNPFRAYRQFCESVFGSYEAYCLFITPTGLPVEDEAERNHWVRLSYQDIAEILRPILQAAGDSSAVRFAFSYVGLLERWFTFTTDANRLSRDIVASYPGMWQSAELLPRYREEIGAIRRRLRGDELQIRAALRTCIVNAKNNGQIAERGDPPGLLFSPVGWATSRERDDGVFWLEFECKPYDAIAVVLKTARRSDAPRGLASIVDTHPLVTQSSLLEALNDGRLDAEIEETWQRFIDHQMNDFTRAVAAQAMATDTSTSPG